MPIAKKVIFNSQPVISFSKEYEGVKDSQVIYIPNGIDLPQIDISPLQEWKKENHISHDIKIIGMIGRLSEQKAYADAISAFSKTENTILVIIGEGHLENELSELVQKLKVESRVYFLGTKPKAYTWLKGFDLFLLSSLWEGMPNVIMEAMYLKVPIVSTNIDSVRDLLDDKRANLVEPGDIDSMANSILKLLSQSELAQQKVDLAYEEIKNNYSLSRMIDQYDEVYDEKL